MLDLKRIQRDPEAVEAALSRRGPGHGLGAVRALDEERRQRNQEYDELRHQQRTLSEVFRGPAPAEEKAAARGRLKEVSDRTKALAEDLNDVNARLDALLLELPNPPAPEVPDGGGEDDNVVARSWGERRAFDFAPRDHLDIATDLGLLEADRASKVSGARFAVYRGAGARLERALMQLMLDRHVDAGYTEILPPFLVTREAMTGTGQLPKFEEDAFATTDDLFLVPTAEVPVTNLHRDELLEPGILPFRYCAYSACFRREAGSYGKVTRGLIRLHQFQKVELVRFCEPERSAEEHAALVADAEAVLQLLELPYRVVELCAGDLGFAAQRCFDLEVWLPGQGRFVEISSCSNFGEFQARRLNLRYRPEAGGKPRFCHTLNGSGLAIGRTVVALLENGQQADGSVSLPAALEPYMGGVDRLEPA